MKGEGAIREDGSFLMSLLYLKHTPQREKQRPQIKGVLCSIVELENECVLSFFICQFVYLIVANAIDFVVVVSATRLSTFGEGIWFGGVHDEEDDGSDDRSARRRIYAHSVSPFPMYLICIDFRCMGHCPLPLSAVYPYFQVLACTEVGRHLSVVLMSTKPLR